MNELVRTLVALLTALSAAAGTPPANVKFQAPVLAAPAGINVSQVVTPTVTPEPSVEITGTVSTVAGTTITLSNGMTITLATNAQVNGTPQPGVVIQIEGRLQPDGTIIAFEIKVGGKSNDDHENNTNVITGTVTITDVNHIDDDKIITGTATITNDDHIDDHKIITSTATITNDDRLDDHKIITGTQTITDDLGMDNKVITTPKTVPDVNGADGKFQNIGDKNKSQNGGNRGDSKGNSSIGGQSPGSHDGNGGNQGDRQNQSPPNQAPPNSGDHGDGGGGDN